MTLSSKASLTAQDVRQNDYEELEQYLKEAEEEINAVFARQAELHPTPKCNSHCTKLKDPPRSSRRLSDPSYEFNPRRRCNNLRKLTPLPHSSTDVLSEWSHDLLKEFHLLVEAELQSLHNCNRPPTPPPRSSSHAQVSQWLNKASDAMGSAHSVYYDPAFEGLSFRTLPRPSPMRSVSLSSAAHRSGHPEDRDISCKLLKINPRYSRSLSLDEGHFPYSVDSNYTNPTEDSVTASNNLNSHSNWISQFESNNDLRYVPECKPNSELHADTNDFNEIFSTSPTSNSSDNNYNLEISKSVEDNRFECNLKNHLNPSMKPALYDKARKFGTYNKPPNGCYVTTVTINSPVPETLDLPLDGSWAWADQDGICGLTDRICGHCKQCINLNESQSPAASITWSSNSGLDKKYYANCESLVQLNDFPSVSASNLLSLEDVIDTLKSSAHGSVPIVFPNEVSSSMGESNSLVLALRQDVSSLRDIATPMPLCSLHPSGRKSEPVLPKTIPTEDPRRHTLASPFCSSILMPFSEGLYSPSWETLPPDEEMDVMENKPLRPEVPSPPYHSLNSSLSSLSQLSLRADTLGSNSLPDSPLEKGPPETSLKGALHFQITSEEPLSAKLMWRSDVSDEHLDSTINDLKETEEQVDEFLLLNKLISNIAEKECQPVSVHSEGDFLREVETRIPCGDGGMKKEFQSSEESLEAPPLLTTPSSVHDATTQTSRASSALSDCDGASLQPCPSSLVLTDDEDEWWEEGSCSSHSSSCSTSPAESVEDLNLESGIGTASTRPSVSPPSHAHALDFSGSSEDTGLETSFERRRRFLPNSQIGRQSSHAFHHYRRRRLRVRPYEQWVRRENQMTQTDVGVPKGSPTEPGESEGKAFAQSLSEPHLNLPEAPKKKLREGISEAALLFKSKGSSPCQPLPPLSEGKPPVSPDQKDPTQRPRYLALPVPSKASSAPILDSRSPVVAKPLPLSWVATSPSDEDSSGDNVLIRPQKAHSSQELAELEAIEACKWLRAAGFPQYAQMYEDLQFPLELVSVETDHAFLDHDSLQALYRRLRILNRCAKIRLDAAAAKKSKTEESDDEEQECALSRNWQFQRNSRRWSRVVNEQFPSYGNAKPCSDLGKDDCGTFKRSGSERLKDGAKAFLRRVESLKNKGRRKKHSSGLTISDPKVLDQAYMEARVVELGCVEISPVDIQSRTFKTMVPTVIHRNSRHATPGEDSSSMTSDHSQTSTPNLRSRRKKKMWRKSLIDGTMAHSDSECSPQIWRHLSTDANCNNHNKMIPYPESNNYKIANYGKRPPPLRHASSFNYCREAQIRREQSFTRAKSEDATPTVILENSRHSIYDNIPLVICNKSYQDFKLEMHDSENSMIEGSGSSECTMESHESPIPSAKDDIENEDSLQRRRRAPVERWHSFNRKPRPTPPVRLQETQISAFSVGQMLHLRKRALLRLTALMENHCPTNRTSWNWELPKFMRKIKPPDYKDRKVFGVPLTVINQRAGHPLPEGIRNALHYLRSTSLDTVGIFRKPGVRSRIQHLRELHELGHNVNYSNYGTYDIADMVKTYFRELPEVLVTNKLSEILIAIFQYLPHHYRLEALQCAFLMMPDENREVLLYLLHFFADVAVNSSSNQMPASNLAMCLAPSLFNLNLGGAGSSPLRRRAVGTPEQKDLSENKAAHECLSFMIQEVSRLQCVPFEMLANCRFSYLEQSQPVALEDLGVGSPGLGTLSTQGNWAAYMRACITCLLKEAREKSRAWVNVSYTDSEIELSYRKVGDGHPLRLWRVATEVEAPPSEVLNRVLRERHFWDDVLLKWRVVQRLDRLSEVFQYMCNSMPPRPPVDYCVLRCWRNDIGRGICVIVETSVEHFEAPVLVGAVRGIVLASRYLIQPCGSGKSRITHITRIDMRGRMPEWYHKCYGHVAASYLTRLRHSFQHTASGPESKV